MARMREPAGKHPTLRPRMPVSPAPEVTKPVRIAKKQQPRQNQGKDQKSFKVTKPAQPATSTSRRIIFTRSKARIFRLLDLPAELRSLIHEQAASSHSAEGPVNLSTLTVPPELSLSKQFRAEALPAFFAATHFTVTVMSNYCVFRRHFHHEEHVRYERAGSIVLPPVLTFDDDGHLDTNYGKNVSDAALRESTVRLKHITISVVCVCCLPAKQIARLDLYLQGQRAAVECKLTFKPNAQDTKTEPSMELIFEKVREAVDAIGSSDGFNGFTVADVVTVAEKASYDGDEKMEAGRGVGH